MAITVTSPSFAPGERIPKKHAYAPEGENVSPALRWSGVPRSAKELALLCDDPDAPMDEPWVHWVLFKIPTDATGLDEGAKVGVAGGNSWSKPGWGGPLPPKGHGIHHYHFKVFALDAPLALKKGATKADLLKAIQGHVLSEGEIVGTYSR
ncbi:MAG TPA: YbhB/YbcL family Raf kinase inhibitor-like protein [Planctomycetota bacterium]|nr:YbhB/YbcL family Raf kinase inhibitor-like protein [Planctomycetota bacterium]